MCVCPLYLSTLNANISAYSYACLDYAYLNYFLFRFFQHFLLSLLVSFTLFMFVALLFSICNVVRRRKKKKLKPETRNNFHWKYVSLLGMHMHACLNYIMNGFDMPFILHMYACAWYLLCVGFPLLVNVIVIIIIAWLTSLLFKWHLKWNNLV